MIKLVFKEEMIEILSSLKGKKLKSFEWESIEPGRFPLYAVRINTGRFAVDLLNEVPDDTPEEAEDVSCLSCQKNDLNSTFYYGTSTKEYAINEKIVKVYVVTDTISADGKKECIMDVALLIQTEYSMFALTKTWFMGEAIEINYEGLYYSEEKTIKDWQHVLGDNVKLHREVNAI